MYLFSSTIIWEVRAGASVAVSAAPCVLCKEYLWGCACVSALCRAAWASQPHRRVACLLGGLCVLHTLVCVSVPRDVFVFLSYSYQSMLCLNLSSPCGGVQTGFLTTGLPEQASPTSVGGGPRSWPWGYTSTRRCVEFMRNTTQSSSFVPGHALVTPHAPSVQAFPTAGRGRAQLHPGAWALT